MSLELPDQAATERLARTLAPGLGAGDVVALAGDLGSGKTTLARALIRALTGDAAEEVPSPTFTLVQCYDTETVTVWHFDLYRLTDPDEVVELGWDDACAGGIVLVEWPERAGSLLPVERLEVALAMAGEHARRAVLTGSGGWARRLAILAAEGLP
jgi:tRNA threonylcarbamoyladenosine biosynthesis protein TsaE